MMVRYSLEDYDAHGHIKAPLLLWLGWLFLARSWLFFIMAAVSKSTGNQLLALVYPDRHMLYVELLMGMPSVLLMWVMGLRHPNRPWVQNILQYGHRLTCVVCMAQWTHSVYRAYLHYHDFHWNHALTITLLVWFMIYLINGRQVKDCFKVLW